MPKSLLVISLKAYRMAAYLPICVYLHTSHAYSCQWWQSKEWQCTAIIASLTQYMCVWLPCHCGCYVYQLCPCMKYVSVCGGGWAQFQVCTYNVHTCTCDTTCIVLPLSFYILCMYTHMHIYVCTYPPCMCTCTCICIIIVICTIPNDGSRT